MDNIEYKKLCMFLKTKGYSVISISKIGTREFTNSFVCIDRKLEDKLRSGFVDYNTAKSFNEFCEQNNIVKDSEEYDEAPSQYCACFALYKGDKIIITRGCNLVKTFEGEWVDFKNNTQVNLENER